MKITTLTPSRISSYATGLAKAASRQPGCKVKLNHLLHAIAQEEGWQNWQAYSDYLKKSPAYSFYKKTVEIGYFKDLGFRVTGFDLFISIAGFEETPLVARSSFSPKDSYWFSELTPVHYHAKLDSVSGLSMVDAYENYTIAMSEFVELLDSLNRRREALRLKDFAGWDVVVDALEYHDAAVREELLRAMSVSSVRSEKYELKEILGLCQASQEDKGPEHLLFDDYEVDDATDYINIKRHEEIFKESHRIVVEPLRGQFKCIIPYDLYAPFEALGMIKTRKVGDSPTRAMRCVKFFKYSELNCKGVFPEADSGAIVRLEIDEVGRLEIAIPSIQYSVFAEPSEMFDMWVLFASVFVDIKSDKIIIPTVAPRIYSMDDCVEHSKQVMQVAGSVIEAMRIRDDLDVSGVEGVPLAKAMGQLLKHLGGGVQIDTALMALYPGRFNNKGASPLQHKAYRAVYDKLGEVVRSSSAMQFMDGALSTIVLREHLPASLRK